MKPIDLIRHFFGGKVLFAWPKNKIFQLKNVPYKYHLNIINFIIIVLYYNKETRYFI